MPCNHAVEVLIRRIHRGRIWFANAGIALQDDERLLVVWLPPGATVRSPEGDLFGDWELVETVRGEPVIRLMPVGRAHAVLLFWTADWQFRGWYVNLETRKRHGGAVDVIDQYLDVWVRADGTVEWLDEDELAQAVESGFLTAQQASEARAEGERVLEEWPFPTGWEDWRPDPSWMLPALPEGWNA